MDTLERRNKPQFCIITPTAYLDRFASQSSMHLVLGHLVDTDEEYAEYYRNTSKFKIMDNGAFELGESYEPNKLIDLGKKCGADAIVLPDYPFQDWRVTADAADQWRDKVRDAGFYTFYCPQSETGDWEGWLQGYNWGRNQGDIDILGMSILSIPNALPHIPKAYARVVATELMVRNGDFAFDKYHHYLGLNAGPALEIPALIEMGALDSCDSSGPVWQGILGHEYTRNTDSYSPVKKIRNEVQFDFPMLTDDSGLQRIQHNIDLTLDLFK